MRVLCVAAHPDDEVLGVGGTLLRHQDAGDRVWVVLAHPCRAEGELESHRAAAALDIEYEHLWVTGRTVADAVGDYLPDIVYTHSLADLHANHRELHEAVLVACRPQSGVKAIYAFETPSATEWGMTPFRPTRYVDIGSTLRQKNEALLAYHSELRPPPHPRNVAGVIKYAQFRGMTAGVEYAEAFEVIRETW